MKKNRLFLLIAVMMLSIIPNVFAATTYGTVKDITEATGDSLTSGKGTISTSGDTTTIRYDAATFKMLEADDDAADGVRPGPAAWIGFEITEPDDKKDSSFKVTMPDDKVEQIKAGSFKDFVGITPHNLEKVLLEGKLLTYKYSFDWDEDGTDDQFVIIQIDPEKVTLTPTEGEEESWSPEIAKKIKDEKNTNPDTSDINLFLLIGLLTAGGAGLAYYFKKA